MTILFISDLHLCEERPKLTVLFEKFMEKFAPKAKQLFILGDFFDQWAGDDGITDYHLKIAELSRNLAEKYQTQIYFLSGNRDFLIGKDFCAKAHWQLIEEPYPIVINGISVLLIHGDRQCLNDRAHLYYRRFTDWGWARAGYLALPLKIRKKIATSLQGRSSRYADYKTYQGFDAITPSTLTSLYEKYNSEVIIHGHIHWPLIEMLPEKNGKIFWRYGLSDWHQQGNFLCWGEDNSRQLVYFD